ncbi:hypothetical protein FB446DRAFT_735432 [Lentinula raphanica]|nr:hypothetical protein FB446DRAFT_735432 [Lentinula raphanica]
MTPTFRAALRQQAHQANLHALGDPQHMSDDFRNIYTTLTYGLSTEETKLIVQPPPLELMILVVRNMMYPELLSASIPDLLEVLSNVEKWRKIANGRAGYALANDEYWPHYNKPYSSGLTDKDRKVLKFIVDAHEVTRTHYVEILMQYCNLHLCHIWTSKSLVDVEYFAQVFQSYFSQDTVKLCPPLKELTQDELAQFTDVKKEWTEFIAECARSGYSTQPNVKLPSQEQVCKRTEAYLVLVQKQVDTLERIFDEDAYESRLGTLS